MELGIIIILLLISAFSLLILYHEKLLHSPKQVIVCFILASLAFTLRAFMLSYETLDYQNFLAPWIEFFKNNGGFAGLSQSVGNYNIPYLTFLAAFSYSSLSGLHLIKLLSIFFDVILAWGSVKLVSIFNLKHNHLIAVFFTVLFLPTVVLNGALWGQCDSIYVAFAVWAVYFGIKNKPVLAMIFIAISFSFKLQAVFIMPIFLIFLLAKRMKIWHFFIFPITYLVTCLPAVIAGRPVIDTILLYFNQASTVGTSLNYNSSSIFAIFWTLSPDPFYEAMAIVAAALVIVIFAYMVYKNGGYASNYALLAIAVIFAVGIPFFLPHMHDRYFFAADIFTLCFAFVLPQYFVLPILCQFASLLGYHAYLKMQFFLPMRYGAYGLIVILVVLAVYATVQIRNVKASG